MSILPFVVIAFGAGTASLVLRERPTASRIAGLGGLLLALGAALAIVPDDALVLSGGRLVATEYLRLFLALGVASGLIVCVISLATSWEPKLPGAVLVAFGTLGLALAMADIPSAVGVALIAGLIGVAATIPAPAGPHAVTVVGGQLRIVTLAGGLALVGTAWLARPLLPRGADPALVGFAYLAVVAAVAVRFGAIPFHAWATRVADTASPAALPLLLAWAPAGFAVVALGWVDGALAPLAIALPAERAVVIGIALLCLVLGALAAWVQDDVEHVVGYAVVADAGVILLALATLDPGAWLPARLWILAFVLVRTAFAAWAVALVAAFGTRRVDELSGWIRRAPTLGLALALVAIASIGLPGLAAFDARREIVGLAVGEPLDTIVGLAPFVAILYYVRLASIGLSRPGAAVAAGPTERPRQPRIEPQPSQGGVDAAGWIGVRDRGIRLARVIAESAAPAWQLNRTPIAAGLVLLLAVAAVAAAGGWLGVVTAAASAAPGVSPGQ